MKINIYFLVGTFLCLFIPFMGQAQVNQADVEDFTRNTAYSLKQPLDDIESIVSKAEFKQDIIDKMTRPAEKTMTWERYRNIFMKEERINAGVDFWNKYETELTDVSQKSGVSIETILGIIGVETFYGQRMGTYRVLDALYTLAFGYPRRSSFFKSELSKFLELCDKEGLDPLLIKGSYAGAMGYGQFMPSSYLAYAKSYDTETGADLMNSAEDGIASVANYIDVHRWVEGGEVAIQAVKSDNAETLAKQKVKPSNTKSYYSAKGYEPVSQFDENEQVSLQVMELEDGSKEYWYTFKNFYVITRYNHSPLYALAVYQLGQAVREAKGK